MRAPSVIAVLALCVWCQPRGAAAQPAANGRFRVSIDAGGQLSSSSLTTSTTQPVYLENAVINTTYPSPRGVMVDAGVSIRVARSFGIGVLVSSMTATNDAAVSAAVPHPFFFKTPRTVTGSAPGQERDELAVHLQAVYMIHPGRHVDVALAAGPSFFQVHQDVVTGITFTDTYPYDTATFTSSSSTRVSANATGFNAGVDVGWRLARHAGLGGSARVSRATASLTMPNSATRASADAGGVQLAGGLRLYF